MSEPIWTKKRKSLPIKVEGRLVSDMISSSRRWLLIEGLKRTKMKKVNKEEGKKCVQGASMEMGTFGAG